MSRQMDERNSPVLFDTTRVIDRNDDILGRAGLADSIAKALSDLAKDEKRLPCSVALFGPWGGGKTTVILWAIKSLRGEADNDADNDGEADKDVVPLYVSVKTCGGNLLLALLRALREKTNTKIRKIKGVFKNLAPILPALVGVFHSGLGTLAEKGLRSVKALLKKEPFEEFRSLLGKIAPDKTPIIFLDDLDRLPPLHAVEVLEQIELLLGITPTTEDELREPEREKEPKRKEEPKHEEEPESSKKHPKFILVVAVDPEILVMGLKSKYGERIFTDTHAHSYIAKHFQHRFTLQPPTLQTAYNALARLLDLPIDHLPPILKPGEHISRIKTSDSDQAKYTARNIETAEISAIFENMRFCKQAAEFARTVDYKHFDNSTEHLLGNALLEETRNKIISLFRSQPGGQARQQAITIIQTSEGYDLASFVLLARRGEPVGEIEPDQIAPWLTTLPRVLVFLVQLLSLHAPDIARWFANCPRNHLPWEAIAFHNQVWTRDAGPIPKWNNLENYYFAECAGFAGQPLDDLRQTIKKRETIRHIAGAINTVSRGSWELVRAALEAAAK